MSVDRTARRVILGEESSLRAGWVSGALVLFLLTALYALLAHFVSDAKPWVVLWGFVLVGAAFASVAAYRNAGLVVSWLLVLGPVCGPLAFYRWLLVRQRSAPVALAGNFYGYRAAGYLLPVAFILGTLAFGIGTLGRRGTNYLADR